jgi:cytochrome P450
LASAVEEGRGDLIPLARRAMMSIAAEIAGVDRPAGTEEEFEDLYSIMTRLSRASTVVHATGDKAVIVEDGLVALDEFERRFLQPSMERRRLFLQGADPDDASGPKDVLTTLMRNQDALDLPPEVVLREVGYFPWVGSHSTSNALAHAMDHIFGWLRDNPDDRSRLEEDPEMVQRFGAESLRLHPPSPEALRRALANVELPSGTKVSKGATVIIDVASANRDESIFGADAGSFDPFRSLPDGVGLWGLAFGSGFHACLGQDLAGGTPATAPGTNGPALAGSIATMARILLEHGARPDPDDPPTADPASMRPHFGRYPIIFG